MPVPTTVAENPFPTLSLSPPQMVYMGAMGHGGLPLSVTSSYIILLLYMLAVVINLSVRDWRPMWYRKKERTPPVGVR